MKHFAKLFVAVGMSAAQAALVVGSGHTGQATNVTIVDLREGDGFVILTFSEPLTDGPPCAAKNRNVLVIGNGNNSPDAATARRAFQLGQALKVSGSGACSKIDGYETLSAIEVMQ